MPWQLIMYLGRLDKAEMESMLLTMGNRYTLEQVQELFHDVPVDADGQFDYMEMARIMKYGNTRVNEEYF